VQEQCQDPADSAFLSICLSVLRLTIHIPALAVSKGLEGLGLRGT